MTLKDFCTNFKSSVVKGAKAIAKAVVNAPIGNVIKAGIFVGSTIVTLVLTYKRYKDRKKAYKDATTNDTNKSTFDRAMQLNYADRRNQEKLHPLMKEVKKSLNKGSKKKSKKRYSTSYSDYVDKLRREKAREEGYDDIYSEYEIFKREMEEEKRRRIFERDNRVESDHEFVDFFKQGLDFSCI